MNWSITCCDLHGRNCEPPGELCCWECTEARHGGWRDVRGVSRYGHPAGELCSNPDLSVDGSLIPVPRLSPRGRWTFVCALSCGHRVTLFRRESRPPELVDCNAPPTRSSHYNVPPVGYVVSVIHRRAPDWTVL